MVESDGRSSSSYNSMNEKGKLRRRDGIGCWPAYAGSDLTCYDRYCVVSPMHRHHYHDARRVEQETSIRR
jgi:hypothetical protein